MRCWRLGRLLELRALSWESRAALAGKARRQQPRPPSRDTLGFQAAAPETCSAHPRELQGAPLLRAGIGSLGSSRRALSSSAGDKDGRDEPEGPPAGSAAAPRPAAARRRAWHRSLSPSERLSLLVHGEHLSPHVAEESSSPPFAEVLPHEEPQRDRDSPSEELRDAPSKNAPFQVGDLFLAESRRRRDTEFKKLCKLTAAGVLTSTWGSVKYADIVGKLPGQMFLTSTGHAFLIRRPSLEEFVLLMERGPTISYPKDINAMLLLMDVSQGDTVLEAGSGSGGMSLFLSRAVGPQGRVVSYEVRKDHYRVAKKNYKRWCDAWKISHPLEWPDNVDFINEDILTAAEALKNVTFDAIALDMLEPQNVLSVVIPNLKMGGVCAVYLANITQVIDLVEAIRTSKINLFCERIFEVTHRDWIVLPASWKIGGIFHNMKSKQNMNNEPACHDENEEIPAEQNKEDDALISDETKPPYIARPYSWQVGHTAFLVKLRKYNPAYPNTTSNGIC
ncbi:tRNA (adenine(58)-N(1))-methyltransferase, mitochondrial [Lacerta agilis]|uniref:tRNA (adenine(58)-N(1))-methyltransferase, mitochondrial n=1 Tax=Lacerta agilis TaxID=80427 RepID=UPI00141A5910|nr:tRNA (adenine(58)-N(1))-methyltransferase, mitochondrial [Lacerta agilis]